MEIISISSSEIVARQKPNLPVSRFNYVPIDLQGMSVEKAFALGMAYSLLENRGIEIPAPSGVITNAEAQTEVI